MATPWDDEKEDRAVLRELFSEEGAKLKPAFSEVTPDFLRPDGTIRRWAIHGSSFEPLNTAWTGFFKKKYPGRKGELLFTKYWNSVLIKHEPDRGFILREMLKTSLLDV